MLSWNVLSVSLFVYGACHSIYYLTIVFEECGE